MKMKKIIFALSTVSIMTLTSCGGSGLRHTVSLYNDVYHADLNHDGVIDPDTEDNLTWIEAYDNLIKEANSMTDLNEIADNLHIAESEIKRTSLARYEILHQAEELVMSTGAVVPIYNYGDPYLLKPNIGGAYDMDLGYKFFEQLEYKDHHTRDFNISVGTKAESFDPAVNSDVSTTLAMNQFLIGAMRYVRGSAKEGYDDREPIYNADLTEGLCEVSRKLVTSDPSKVASDPDNYVLFTTLGDLSGESPSDYEGTARYTITVKDNAVWSDSPTHRIKSDDFIYEWNRASSGVYNGQAFGVWCNMFDMIRGYNVWSIIGQQKSLEAAKAKKEWAKLSDTDKAQYEYQWEQTGCAGGMAGVVRKSDYEFEVQLINDCDYFKQMLAALMFMPVPKDNIIIIPQGATEKNTICSEHGDWWLNSKGEYLTNGPLKIKGKIDNTDGGGINLTRNTNFKLDSDCKVDNLHFKFIDKDSTIYSAYKSGAVDLINQFPSSVIDDASKTPDWCMAQQIGLFFYDFNVNDNTFDIRQETDKLSGERNREKLRKAAMLLVNRDDIAVNVAKKGCTAANGFVSAGVVESCVPKWDETAIDPITGDTGAYVADTVINPITNEEEYVTKDWTKRNLNTYDYLKEESEYDPEEDYNDYIMGYRDEGGFMPIVGYKEMTEREVMEENTSKAIQLAKEAGVNYDKKTGKFTNFPRINIATNNGSGLEDIAERMQAYYGLWGIDVTITTQEWQSFTATRRIGDFACARQGWVADYSDPRTYLDLCCSDSGNNDTQLGKKSWHWSH